MLNILRRLLSRNTCNSADDAELKTAPRFAVFLPARLLLSVAPSSAPKGRRIVAGTLNVSETGMALALPTPEIAGRKISQGDSLDVQLDIYPAGVIGMTCEVVWHRPYDDKHGSGLIVGVRICDMSHTDRARFLEYLATEGWEKAVG